MTIDGKIILITGASHGIGKATAQALARKGAILPLAARSEKELQALTEELPGSFAIPIDLLEPGAVERMIHTAINRFGRIDVLINNAGQGLYAPIEKTDIEEYRRIMELNVFVPLMAMQTVIPLMRAQGGGMIVNTSSMVSKMHLPGLGAYASTKYALNALSLTARAELEEENIVVSIVLPGYTDTDFGKNALGGGRDAMPARRRNMPVANSPEKVAAKMVESIETERPETLLMER